MKIENMDLLLTGVPSVDAQHRALGQLIADFDSKKATGSLSDEDLTVAIDGISNYMIDHFDSEEFLMRSIDYPSKEFEAHVAVHEEIKNMWSGYCAMIAESNDNRHEVTVEGVTFIRKWFVNHIAMMDKDIAYFIKKTRKR